MDGTNILFALLLTVAFIIFSIVISCTLCCICFAIPIIHLCSHFFRNSITSCLFKERINHNNYELISASATSNQNQQIVAAHAEYLVPPLIEVQTLNSVNVIEHQNSTNNSSSSNSNDFNDISSKERFRDVWAAVLFMINVVILLYFAISSITYLQYQNIEIPKDKSSNYDYQYLIGEGLVLIILVASISSFIGYFVLSFLINHADNIIENMIWLNIITQLVMAFISLLTLNIFGVLMFGLFGILTYWYLQSVRHQIPFASAVLATACKGIKVHYQGILVTAYSTLIMKIVWFLIWITAMIGIYQMNNNNASNSNNSSHNDETEGDKQHLPLLEMFLTIFSLYWGVEVLRALLQTTVSGTIACWWFQPQRQSPVKGSFFRSVTTSFGSICFGSLLVAFIQSLRAILHHLKNQTRRIQSDNRRNSGPNLFFICVLACAECLLRAMEDILKYFNKYAYCYVAAYGLGFIESGKQVTNLFTRRGWTAIINDGLISRALSCGLIVITLISVIAGGVLSIILSSFMSRGDGGLQSIGNQFLIGCILGGITGLMVGSILIHILDSAVAMVFVCFAEDPLALQSNHEEIYNNLSFKWEQMHPNTMQWTNASTYNTSTHNINNNNPSHAYTQSYVPAATIVIPENIPPYNQQVATTADGYIPTSSKYIQPSAPPANTNETVAYIV